VARFYAYLVRERHRPDLPLEAIRVRLGQLRGKRPKKLPRVPPDDVMERVLAAAHGVPTARSRAGESIRLRDIALTETLRGSGCASRRQCRCGAATSSATRNVLS